MKNWEGYMRPEEVPLVSVREYTPRCTYLVSDQQWVERLQKARASGTVACFICSIIACVDGVLIGFFLL